MCLPSVVLKVMASTHLVKYSVAAKKYLYPFDVDGLIEPTTSNGHIANGHDNTEEWRYIVGESMESAALGILDTFYQIYIVMLHGWPIVTSSNQVLDESLIAGMFATNSLSRHSQYFELKLHLYNVSTKIKYLPNSDV